MCIITYVERQAESMEDWVLEFKYLMIEEVGNGLGNQIEWLNSSMLSAIECECFSDLAALAMLRGWIEQELQELRDNI